jgi:hypothetical protein
MNCKTIIGVYERDFCSLGSVQAYIMRSSVNVAIQDIVRLYYGYILCVGILYLLYSQGYVGANKMRIFLRMHAIRPKTIFFK